MANLGSLYNRLRKDRSQSRMSVEAIEERLDIKSLIQNKLTEKLGVDSLFGSRVLSQEKQAEVKETIAQTLLEEEGLTPLDREQLQEELFSEIVGYGPIQTLLEDPSVDEIMVNDPEHTYVERNGKIERSSVRFGSTQEIMHIIERIVSPLGRRIDEASPMVDARLPDGSRVNAIVPPLAIHGPTLTIRKFPERPLAMEDLIEHGSLDRRMAQFLSVCVRSRLNIIVAGGTGSGKTTTLNALSSYIPHNERIITIEDAAELKLQQDHVVSLETRPANMEGKGEVGIRQLVRNSLRMRPDRIIVGEVRSGEALDMLQAMNTGHDGSLTSVHANSPRDVISRLETMVLMAGIELPSRAIREQIVSAVDLIIHQSRGRDGIRRIINITEVQGLESDTVILQDIFIYKEGGTDLSGRPIGYFTPTGLRPSFGETISRFGYDLPPDVFTPVQPL